MEGDTTLTTTKEAEKKKKRLTFVDVLAGVTTTSRGQEKGEAPIYVTLRGEDEGGERWSFTKIFKRLPAEEELNKIGAKVRMVRVTRDGAILIKRERMAARMGWPLAKILDFEHEMLFYY